MFHKNITDNTKPDYTENYKIKLGVIMFFIYSLIYAGFIAINVLAPLLMAKKIIFGLNLAVVYGFGLIIFAVISALIYNHFCSKKEETFKQKK